MVSDKKDGQLDTDKLSLQAGVRERERKEKGRGRGVMEGGV